MKSELSWPTILVMLVVAAMFGAIIGVIKDRIDKLHELKSIDSTWNWNTNRLSVEPPDRISAYLFRGDTTGTNMLYGIEVIATKDGQYAQDATDPNDFKVIWRTKTGDWKATWKHINDNSSRTNVVGPL